MDNFPRRAHLLFSPNAVQALSKCIKNIGTKLKTDSVLVFVCGAKASDDIPTARDAFMEHASLYLREYRFFRAEDVFSAIRRRPDQDILSMEGRLAEFSDCIIIILESPGSFAELGAFAYDKNLSQIVMAVNDVAFRNASSFVSDGPIKRLDRVSKFKPAIYADIPRNGILSSVAEIENRLGVIKKVYRKRINLSASDEFRECPGKWKILFLSDLIALFSPLSYQDIIKLLAMMYEGKMFNLKMEIALLEAIGLINNIDGFYVRSLAERALFYDFENMDPIMLRSEVFNHYHKYHDERLTLLHRVPRYEL